MRVTKAQAKVLKRISQEPGGELDDSEIASITSYCLLREKLIEKCPRLYFGPRALRYRLTQAGKDWVQAHS